LSTSAEAAARYRTAIEAELAAEAGVAERLEQAVACDPSFALAHAARAIQAHGRGDRAAASAARDAALAALEGVTAWERSHVECIAALTRRDEGAWTKCREHLKAHPLDLLVVSLLIGDLFFHGGVGKREAVMDVLRPLASHYGDDWAFTARLGFHTSELGDPEGALALLDRALAARPHAPFIAHARAHALLESGRREESHRFLVEWTSRHDPAGPIDGHIAWHLSLGDLEGGEPTAAVQRYLRSSAPGKSHCAAGLMLADAGGLFFRMVLAGAPLDGMPRAELHEVLVNLRRALKIPFVAVHAAALALALDDDEAADYLDGMASYMGTAATDPAALAVAALQAYRRGDPQACVHALDRDRPTAFEAIGGSNEERELLEQLYSRASAQLASA
jgi:tetratricopeptide (TPR) repeat protein